MLDYIYAVLHSPTYRETYKEFLKIDFPRVPYPEDAEKFWKLVKLGGELRSIHLLESPLVEDFITSYPIDGDNVITRKITRTSPGYEPKQEILKQVTIDEENKTSNQNVSARSEVTKQSVTAETGKVWINDTQYFENVPKTAWEFYIGGYQPAQKWLKDRKGRKLSFEDILHYQKIIVALTETHRLMQEIDKIEIIHED
ncbi:type ISP restriction/modification enzyme [Gramella sp. AN32]|uniref:Type ISP restriction/modification enzyme n=1 Tax=Christiangramia antarctica TaxID=2058158 RepID=A0ABW5X0A0_9FLAO